MSHHPTSGDQYKQPFFVND